MPEGHTIHRIASDHHRWFAGHNLAVQSPQGRFGVAAKRLSGRKLVRVDACGKHLFYHFSRDRIHVHLGLYGRFRLHKTPPPAPRGEVRLRLIGPTRATDLNGPHVCELISPSQLRTLMERLGPDPLRQDADPAIAWNRIQSSRSAIGSLLLNQSVIAGLGNIYRAEILHLLAIHPDRPGREITQSEFEAIWDLAVSLLKVGKKFNRIVTVKPSKAGRRQSEALHIYKQPHCPRCGADVYYWQLANRTIYACDACQR